MTCLMSPPKHALLPLRGVAVTVGNGACTPMRKIIYSFGGSARRRKHEIHPTDTIVGAGRVGRGLGKGGGVLLAWATALCLVEDTRCHRDGNIILVASILVAVGQFSPCGSAKLAVLAT